MTFKQPPLQRFFGEMPVVGRELSSAEIKRAKENQIAVLEIEKELEGIANKIKRSGKPDEKIHEIGQMTAYERLDYLVDPGTWRPFHSIFNPEANDTGTTSVIDGLGRIKGKWAVIIAFNNKILAGAWVAGMPENILRATDLAKRLNIPLVWLLNCSGVKLTEQEKAYPKRRGGGATFYRHAELNRLGIPVLNAIYGTNPAGGGYHGISPTILLAHRDSNIAVGGAGIVGGMNPKGYFDIETVMQVIETTRDYKAVPPGRMSTHFNETGYIREIHDTETGVLDGIKEYMEGLPAYDPKFFRVAEPAEPLFKESDLYYILPTNQKRTYDSLQVVARLVDSSEFMEFKSEYGPEMFCGIAKISGLPVGMIGNRQGFYTNYPEYYPGDTCFGVGGKLYRQGLIKMNEFVTLCGRDNLPIIWLQDTTGIDVGDLAEKAELLGLGQALIYSIQKTDLPMMCLVLRKGTAAAHYVLGGPQGNDNNAFTIGTPITQIYVMHGETAAIATYSRRLVKEHEMGKSLEPIIKKMNEMVEDYRRKSTPEYCAKMGFVDEIVSMQSLRGYCQAFVEANYQNPRSFTPIHQMILPRIIIG